CGERSSRLAAGQRPAWSELTNSEFETGIKWGSTPALTTPQPSRTAPVARVADVRAEGQARCGAWRLAGGPIRTASRRWNSSRATRATNGKETYKTWGPGENGGLVGAGEFAGAGAAGSPGHSPPLLRPSRAPLAIRYILPNSSTRYTVFSHRESIHASSAHHSSHLIQRTLAGKKSRTVMPSSLASAT